jgi:hypothetical protein
MTPKPYPTWDEYCQDCIAWFKLSDQDGGLGICDNVDAEHNQHLIGCAHPSCMEFTHTKDDEQSSD